MFEVEWHQTALDELASIWTQADPVVRTEITAAANQIDRDLSNSPAQRGESRTGDLRIHFCAPLGLSFKVDKAQRTAIVLHVWQFRRHSA